MGWFVFITYMKSLLWLHYCVYVLYIKVFTHIIYFIDVSRIYCEIS